MNLNDKEADILACVEFKADLPIAEIAHETGFREHTIRYHLKNLEEREIISRAPFINILPAGYTFYGIYFSTGPDEKNIKSKVVKKMMGDRRVTWFAEMGGDYQYGMALCVQHISEVEEYLFELAGLFPELFFDKTIACQFSATAFSREYLSAGINKDLPFSLSKQDHSVTLDEIDCKILGALVHEEYRSHRQLAKLLGMPLSSLDLRVKKLEEKKIIGGYFYRVNPQLIGMQEHTLLIYAKGVNCSLRDSLLDFAKKHRAVTYMYECLGSWDYELNIEVAQGSEIARITDEIYRNCGKSINTVKALAKYRDLKLSFVPF